MDELDKKFKEDIKYLQEQNMTFFEKEMMYVLKNYVDARIKELNKKVGDRNFRQ